MQIVYGVNASYVLPALISIYSLWKNAVQPVDITIYIDEITKENQQAIRHVSECCRIPIQIKEFETKGLDKYLNKRFPAISLLPLFLPNLKKGRCLFIDADTLVKGDVWELLSTDLDGMPIGACTDIGMATLLEQWIVNTRVSDIFRPARAELRKKNYIERVAALGFIPKENYFNSGLLLMEIENIRENYPDYAELANIEKLRPFVEFPDQDRLNHFFAGRWYRLPLKWNVRPEIQRDVEWPQYRFRHISDELRRQMHEAITDTKLWHFMGGEKPWIKSSKHARKEGGGDRQAFRDYAKTCLEFRNETDIMFGL